MGGRGFPTFVLASNDKLEVVEIGGFLGDVAGWHAELATRVQT